MTSSRRVRFPNVTAGAIASVVSSPADSRGFIHKRIFGGIKGVIGGLVKGDPLGGGIRGFFGGGGAAVPGATLAQPSDDPHGRCPPGTAVAADGWCRPTSMAITSTMQGGGPCPQGFVMVGSTCIPTSPISLLGGRGVFPMPTGVNGPLVPDQYGAARLGRYGAGLEPARRSSVTLTCPPGSVLGKQEADGSFLCYNRREISNKERKWPRGRRPLLTGGEMRAISVASTAAKKFQRTQKRLQGLGLVSKPSRRGSRRALATGHVAAIVHE